ncbi:PREDICTED: uncharacterized protein LOC109163805 isoform X2 [Ipomoea nil]|uniref:uncharacterized protein LOC109163805 isoform X2 n=1 Tax=Ipomoea nil TaxID=35883 RepID=UPI000900C4FF|nr:PREDICTED: uncharacterized protein LOC109163805 isoform X2 [Ipomoea nil]
MWCFNTFLYNILRSMGSNCFYGGKECINYNCSKYICSVCKCMGLQSLAASQLLQLCIRRELSCSRSQYRGGIIVMSLRSIMKSNLYSSRVLENGIRRSYSER